MIPVQSPVLHKHTPSHPPSALKGTRPLAAHACCSHGRRRVSAVRAVLVTTGPPTTAQSVQPELEHFQPELGWRSDFQQAFIKGKLLGAGSFGQVHLGISQQTGMQVAIKTLPKIRGKLTKDKTLEKIWRETDMLMRLQSCRGVIRLLDCFEDSTNVQIVTEICMGGDLQQYVEERGTLDEQSLASVAFEVLKIVKSCHDLGVLHGDIKPANFVVSEVKKSGFFVKTSSPSHLRAIDFGCSQFLGARRLSKRTGTPIFMAPEIFARSYSESVDTWAMGVMCYWLFCKKFPFFDNCEVMKQAKLEEVAAAISSVPIVYDFGPWKHMSPEGISFMQSCLVRREEDRWSCDQLLQHPWIQKHVSKEQQLLFSHTATAA